MGEMLRQCWPFVLPGLLPVIALLHVPAAGRKARIAWVALLGALAAAFVVDVLVLPHDDPHTLEIATVLADGEPVVLDQVTAPAWHWHVAVAVWLALTALWTWLVRDRAPRTPNPIPVAVAAFAWALAARLALEKTAAPAPIVWSVGATWALLATMPFFGWYAGRRGWSFGKLAAGWLLANVLQRVVFAAVGYVATTRALGTHLDLHTLREVTVPVRGRIELRDATDAWLNALAVPQLFALVFSFAIGLLVAALPWHVARRRAARGAAAG